MKPVKVKNIGIQSNHASKLAKQYQDDNLSEYKDAKWTGSLLKSNPENLKIIPAPLSMGRLIEMSDKDEYHDSCVNAIAESCFLKFECKNSQVMSFVKDMQLPGNEDIISIFSDFVYYYTACGNGILQKFRDLKGQWAGLDRLIPSEVQIIEQFDQFGFLRPDYVQVKSGKKKYVPGKDIMHMIQKTSKSNVWGMACKNIILNVEILSEIKNFDYNQFKNGLLVDYFVIVEGGTLGDKYTEIDESGKEIEIDPFNELNNLLTQAKGTQNGHSVILLETTEGSKVRLEPMRRLDDNGFKELKKDLRDGIMVYHRVPHRLVSLETAGKLGGDNNSDLIIFYNMVVKPIQYRIAYILSREFKQEFGWEVKPDDFDFGNISEYLESIETKLIKK